MDCKLLVKKLPAFFCALLKYAILLSLTGWLMPVSATEGLSIGTGFGAARIVPVRVAFQKTWDKRWNLNSHWPVSGYWEVSGYTMNAHQYTTRSPKHLHAFASAFAFRFEKEESFMLGWPYVELGFGLSWLNKKEIGGRKLGMHVLFEDKFGLGIRFGQDKQYDISYKAIHFSNAYIGSVNNGINLHMLIFGFWFK